jgi:hypothetical protein
MSKKKVSAVWTILFLFSVLLLASCSGGGEGGGPVTVTFRFIDESDGSPVTDVSMYLNGQTRLPDAQGEIVLSSEKNPLPVEGYVNPEGTSELFYFKFDAVESFDVPVYLENQAADVYYITGSVYDRYGNSLEDFDLTIYTPDGRKVGGLNSREGNWYEAWIYSGVEGELIFMVNDWNDDTDFLPAVVQEPFEYLDYFTRMIVSEPPQVKALDEKIMITMGYTVLYPEAGFTLSGTAPGADRVQAFPVLNDRVITDITLGQEPAADDSFSFQVPGTGTPAVKLLSSRQGEFHEPGGEPSAYALAPPTFSQTTGGILLEFAQNDGIGQSWDSGVTLDLEDSTCSWSPAGNATFYSLMISPFGQIRVNAEEGDYPATIYAIIQDTSVSFPDTIALPDPYTLTITPVWSQGVIAVPETDFMVTPFDEGSGTMLLYEYLTNFVTNFELN